MPQRLIVVKVGTSGITTSEGNLDEQEMQRLANQIAAVTRQGDKVVLVTSGAVASGIAELGIPPKAQRRGFSAGGSCNWAERSDGEVP